MSEPSAHTTAHADDAVAPAPSDKPVLALPAPSDDDHVKLEVDGQAFSLYDKMGPTVVNTDGVSLPFPPRPERHSPGRGSGWNTIERFPCCVY
jgi:hypothetical protein